MLMGISETDLGGAKERKGTNARKSTISPSARKSTTTYAEATKKEVTKSPVKQHVDGEAELADEADSAPLGPTLQEIVEIAEDEDCAELDLEFGDDAPIGVTRLFIKDRLAAIAKTRAEVDTNPFARRPAPTDLTDYGQDSLVKHACDAFVQSMER
eukprot:PhF_6_TR36900/c0_g1_i1/m.54142